MADIICHVNGQLATTISLDELGAHIMKFTLPPTALTSVRQDGRHQLAIALNAQFSCLYNINATVIIKIYLEFFKLPFEVSTPRVEIFPACRRLSI